MLRTGFTGWCALVSVRSRRQTLDKRTGHCGAAHPTAHMPPPPRGPQTAFPVGNLPGFAACRVQRRRPRRPNSAKNRVGRTKITINLIRRRDSRRVYSFTGANLVDFRSFRLPRKAGKSDFPPLKRHYGLTITRPSQEKMGRRGRYFPSVEDTLW